MSKSSSIGTAITSDLEGNIYDVGCWMPVNIIYLRAIDVDGVDSDAPPWASHREES